ncbi:MAG: 30S ribosomal protein S2 [Acidobacteria bacterium]|nr:MAG: 30S ribosomal protein S2 [Acidobacteriota bacterium]
MTAISIKQLLEAGVHFGHQTRRWNPKMKEYIFGERNGIYIIDLQKTLRLFKNALDFVTGLSSQGKSVLFVGTKRQAQESIEEEAKRCGMFFVNNRWLGGLLTNFATVQNSLKRYKELESQKANGFYEKLSKKEVARLERERKKLEKNLRGIREMERLPGAIFVVDSNKEAIAVKEAAKLGIPVIAIVDTNCSPDDVSYVIPGNDDALRAVRLFASTVADAVISGKAVYQARVEAEVKEAEDRAAKEAASRRAAKEAKEAARRSQQAPAPAEETVIRGDLAETKNIANDSEQVTLAEETAAVEQPAQAEAAPEGGGTAPEAKKASRKKGPSAHHKPADTPPQPGAEAPQATEAPASAEPKTEPEQNQS